MIARLVGDCRLHDAGLCDIYYETCHLRHLFTLGEHWSMQSARKQTGSSHESFEFALPRSLKLTTQTLQHLKLAEKCKCRPYHPSRCGADIEEERAGGELRARPILKADGPIEIESARRICQADSSDVKLSRGRNQLRAALVAC
jgi:hypothetical protein